MNGLDIIRKRREDLGHEEFQKRVISGKLIKPQDFLPCIPKRMKTIINKAISSNPAQRYQSANEMRRDLEKLLFSGHWTVDSFGNFIGHDKGYEYRCETKDARSNKIHFTAYRKDRNTGNETRIGEHSRQSIERSEIEKIRVAFMSSVIDGTICRRSMRRAA